MSETGPVNIFLAEEKLFLWQQKHACLILSIDYEIFKKMSFNLWNLSSNHEKHMYCDTKVI